MATLFHYSFIVNDLLLAENYYTDYLLCKKGRKSDNWVDFDFFGHQLSCHLSEAKNKPLDYGEVDGIKVPIPHFGVILNNDTFAELSSNLVRREAKFIIEPYVRFKNKKEEQETMFIEDPFGNFLEFKTFKNTSFIF